MKNYHSNPCARKPLKYQKEAGIAEACKSAHIAFNWSQRNLKADLSFGNKASYDKVAYRQNYVRQPFAFIVQSKLFP